jgi:hypothetical protein
MPLEGKLEQFKLLEILEMIALNQKTGILTVESGREKAKVQFKNGAINYLNFNNVSIEDLTLYGILRKKNISRKKYKKLRELAEVSRNSIFDILVSEGIIYSNKLPEYFRRRIETLVYKILSWGEGDFFFKPTDEKIGYLKWNVSLPVNPLLHEGIRRQDEMEYMRDKLPERNAVLHINPSHPPFQTLHSMQVELLLLVDGKNTLQDIYDEMMLPAFRINKEICTLMERNLVYAGRTQSAVQRLARRVPLHSYTKLFLIVLGTITLISYGLLLVKFMQNLF